MSNAVPLPIVHLLSVARSYAAAEGIDLATVSWRVLRDSKKLPSIVNGCDITVGRLVTAMCWFSENWPKGAAWPKGVKRPAVAKKAIAS